MNELLSYTVTPIRVVSLSPAPQAVVPSPSSPAAAATPARLGVVHHAVYPPSATSTDPVMNEAASLARKTTLGAISSGRA